MMYYTYVLRSKKDGKLYCGYTHDLAGRFELHQKGAVPSTATRRPFDLIYYEASTDRTDALHREKYLKTYYGHMFLAKRLKSYFTRHPKKT